MPVEHTLNCSPAQRQVAVVLVEPKFSKNIGSVARAMENFGFSDLRLVAPREFDLAAARVTACWARGVLDKVSVFDSIQEAVSDLVDVVGFSASYGKNRTAYCTLQEFVHDAKGDSFPGTLGLVFGPEDTGLRNEHIPICRTLVRIPSNVNNPSFNVSQAVLLALYELVRQEVQEKNGEEYPVWEDYIYLEEKLRTIMIASDFQIDSRSDNGIQIILGLFKRMRANKREMAMLHGLLSKIKKSLTEEVE